MWSHEVTTVGGEQLVAQDSSLRLCRNTAVVLPGQTAVLEPRSLPLFTEFLPSWNIGGDGCFAVEGRFSTPGGEWSPFVSFGGWGGVPESAVAATSWDVGGGAACVAVDFLTSPSPLERMQLRLVAGSRSRLLVEHISWVASIAEGIGDEGETDMDEEEGSEEGQGEMEREDSGGEEKSNGEAVTEGEVEGKREGAEAGREGESATGVAAHANQHGSTQSADLVLDVPSYSQYSEGGDIGSRICSPASLSMLMAWHGVPSPPASVAALVYDSANDIYGNWNRAVQGAYLLGCPGRLERLSSWEGVARHLMAGRPVAAAITAREGELSGAPYRQTAGHLLVVCGLALSGGPVLVRDPAAPTAEEVPRAYSRRELGSVWLRRGGVAYVLFGTSKLRGPLASR